MTMATNPEWINAPGWSSAQRTRRCVRGSRPADPAPGHRDEQAAINKPMCELIDGTLVEKPVGFNESVLPVIIARAVANFVVSRKLGLVAITDGMFRVSPGRFAARRLIHLMGRNSRAMSESIAARSSPDRDRDSRLGQTVARWDREKAGTLSPPECG